jgi:hypothetical protein
MIKFSLELIGIYGTFILPFIHSLHSLLYGTHSCPPPSSTRPLLLLLLLLLLPHSHNY